MWLLVLVVRLVVQLVVQLVVRLVLLCSPLTHGLLPIGLPKTTSAGKTSVKRQLVVLCSR